MNDRPVRWYSSKIDWWILGILLLVPMVGLAIIVMAISDGVWPAAWIGGGVLAFVVCLYGLCVFPMRYGVNETALEIRCGVFRWCVPLANIREVIPTNNPLSSPALSLDRLWIQYGPKWFQAVMISPKDKSQFITDLASRIPLDRTEQGWKRVDEAGQQ
ncbi:MAG: PH domain-containing protein [Pirellula sp.]|jgi:membrane protein YdbS with pleckstrin-like domain|nr:PH domain-containing protein [Pirellula sp.]